MVIEGEGCSSLPLPSGHCPWEQSWAHAWMVLALKRSPWELFLGLPCHSFLLLLVSAHGCHLDVWAWVCSTLGVEGPTKLCVSLSYTHTHARLCIFLRCCLFFVCFSYRCNRWWSVELSYVCCVLLVLSSLNFSVFLFSLSPLYPFLPLPTCQLWYWSIKHRLMWITMKMNKSSRIKRKTKIRNLYKIPIASSGKANVLAQQSIQIMFLIVNAVGQDRFK